MRPERQLAFHFAFHIEQLACCGEGGGTLNMVNGADSGTVDPLSTLAGETINAGFQVVRTPTSTYNKSGALERRACDP